MDADREAAGPSTEWNAVEFLDSLSHVLHFLHKEGFYESEINLLKELDERFPGLSSAAAAVKSSATTQASDPSADAPSAVASPESEGVFTTKSLVRDDGSTRRAVSAGGATAQTASNLDMPQEDDDRPGHTEAVHDSVATREGGTAHYLQGATGGMVYVKDAAPCGWGEEEDAYDHPDDPGFVRQPVPSSAHFERYELMQHPDVTPRSCLPEDDVPSGGGASTADSGTAPPPVLSSPANTCSQPSTASSLAPSPNGTGLQQHSGSSPGSAALEGRSSGASSPAIAAEEAGPGALQQRLQDAAAGAEAGEESAAPKLWRVHSLGEALTSADGDGTCSVDGVSDSDAAGIPEQGAAAAAAGSGTAAEATGRLLSPFTGLADGRDAACTFSSADGVVGGGSWWQDSEAGITLSPGKAELAHPLRSAASEGGGAGPGKLDLEGRAASDMFFKAGPLQMFQAPVGAGLLADRQQAPSFRFGEREAADASLPVAMEPSLSEGLRREVEVWTSMAEEEGGGQAETGTQPQTAAGHGLRLDVGQRGDDEEGQGEGYAGKAAEPAGADEGPGEVWGALGGWPGERRGDGGESHAAQQLGEGKLRQSHDSTAQGGFSFPLTPTTSEPNSQPAEGASLDESVARVFTKWTSSHSIKSEGWWSTGALSARSTPPHGNSARSGEEWPRDSVASGPAQPEHVQEGFAPREPSDLHSRGEAVQAWVDDLVDTVPSHPVSRQPSVQDEKEAELPASPSASRACSSPTAGAAAWLGAGSPQSAEMAAGAGSDSNGGAGAGLQGRSGAPWATYLPSGLAGWARSQTTSGAGSGADTPQPLNGAVHARERAEGEPPFELRAGDALPARAQSAAAELGTAALQGLQKQPAQHGADAASPTSVSEPLHAPPSPAGHAVPAGSADAALRPHGRAAPEREQLAQDWSSGQPEATAGSSNGSSIAAATWDLHAADAVGSSDRWPADGGLVPCGGGGHGCDAGPAHGMADEVLPHDTAQPVSQQSLLRSGSIYTYNPEEIAARYEVMTLRVFHRKRSTGFEESKDFPIKLDDIIAGRYQVVDFLGSAAFSTAVQALDLKDGRHVCLKIIKNNKDYFDQSLDEIKLLRYVNLNDPHDEYGVLRLFDFFYFKEHLFLVCELLRANLYEWQRFNRESGVEPYFSPARIQRIAIQVLRALAFLHSLDLIHSDLKPENILIKSYSRCEVKVIDLGSSCFLTDHLSSYVQSRSYRAPEVILGLPYDAKIDLWSLGCILAELASGQVLFQNESVRSLLARLSGILGPVPGHMVERARYGPRYFTRSGLVYDRHPTSQAYELLVPKRSSLRQRVPGDDGFLDFLAQLLEIDPERRPTAVQALQHPWLLQQYPDVAYRPEATEGILGTSV